MENICELVNINKSYLKHNVLNDVNMAFSNGEIVAIVGKSGAGKTTILNIMGLLEKPDSGVVRLFGKDICRISPTKVNKILRSKISFLFQNYALIDDATVDYNLEVPLMYSKKNKKEKQNLKLFALKKVGLNVPLKQKIHELSGGEQQRVAIARLFLKPCDLILADEPTGSLDIDNRNEIVKLLKELKGEGKTIIIVTHDEYVAKSCDRIVYLDNV
jgi:putative ABC transport system ATP-binding protein